MKLLIGVLLAFAIGAMCRYFDLPAPSPPTLFGALLVVSLTIGYAGTDWLLTKSSRSTETSAAGSRESK